MEFAKLIILITNYYFYSSAYKVLNEKSYFPSFISVDLSNRTQKMINVNIGNENDKDEEKCESDENTKTIINEDAKDESLARLVFNNKLVFLL